MAMNPKGIKKKKIIENKKRGKKLASEIVNERWEERVDEDFKVANEMYRNE